MLITEKNIMPVPDRLNSAYDFLNTFFDSGLPQEHKKDLKKWRYYVINDEEYNDKHGARHAYTNYEETLQLIETANLLMEHKEHLVSLITVTENIILQEKSTFSYFPNNLSLKQLISPYKVIRQFFKEYSVCHLKKYYANG
jgi:hypothetical protein